MEKKFVANGIRELEQPDFKPCVFLDMNHNARPYLAVVDADGSTRLLRISKKVAEVLIAIGYSYGT